MSTPSPAPATKLATLILDTVTGYFTELAKPEAQPSLETLRTQLDQQGKVWTKGEWNMPWNVVMGVWGHLQRLLRVIIAKHGMTIVVTAQLVPKKIYLGIGKEREGKLIGWQADVPGTGADEIRAAFDELYLLDAIGQDNGMPPTRRLVTQKFLIHDVPFEAKCRYGPTAPILNPTWERIMAGVPKGNPTPSMFLIVGDPGAGKTTLCGTTPGPRAVIDIAGGCDKLAAQSDTAVYRPKSTAEVFKLLFQIEATGCAPPPAVAKVSI